MELWRVRRKTRIPTRIVIIVIIVIVVVVAAIKLF